MVTNREIPHANSELLIKHKHKHKLLKHKRPYAHAMHPREIASELTHGNYISERPRGYTDTIGWEETRGDVLSRSVASQVKRVVEKRTKGIVETSAYDKLVRCPDLNTSVGLWTHSQIELGELLGEGSFNVVYKIDDMPSEAGVPQGNEYVVKVLRKELIKNEVEFAICAADIIKEAILMAALDHPNILKTRAIAATGIAGFEATCRHDAFFMVMGHLKESLEDRLVHWRSKAWRCRFGFRYRTKKQANFSTRLQVATDLADALEYLHSFNILHRDLKPSNIGFDATGTLKLFDFDLARLLPDSRTPNETFALTQKAGSLRYMSPECGKGEPYNLKSDVYSFSLLLYQIVSLREPYHNINFKQQELKVFQQGLRPKISSSWSVELTNLLRRGWSHDITARPSMHEVIAVLERELHVIESKSETS
jgi:serine/threonine protein kinase